MTTTKTKPSYPPRRPCRNRSGRLRAAALLVKEKAFTHSRDARAGRRTPAHAVDGRRHALRVRRPRGRLACSIYSRAAGN